MNAKSGPLSRRSFRACGIALAGLLFVGCVSEPAFHKAYGWNRDSATIAPETSPDQPGEYADECNKKSSINCGSQLPSEVAATGQAVSDASACRGAKFAFEFHGAGASLNGLSPQPAAQ